MTTIAEHEHTWNLVLHIDGCHFHRSGYHCPCGASRITTGERDVHDYGLVWLLPEDCERCKALLGGAQPEFTDEIVLPA